MSALLPHRRPVPSPVPSLVMGLFADPQLANEAFDRLVEASFEAEEISVLLLDGSGVEQVPVDHKTGVPIGVTTGATLGGTLGLAVALGGPVGLGFFAAGPILAALQGVAVGAASGGLLGALAGLAYWCDEPELEAELKRGHILVGVTAAGARALQARKELLAAGATRVFGDARE